MLGTGAGGNVMTGTCGTGAVPALGVVLHIPCRGCFIWPLALAGLGLRYLFISLTLMYGHPFRNPCLVALRRVDIFGLHNDWCANLTLLVRVCIECKNKAPSYMAWGGCGHDLYRGRVVASQFGLGWSASPQL